ncbi:hypothetical protein B0T20DRAFT_402454 [Sordaria brevicollis]|uniref:Uncharacterized protein n=1 Tax=Sordaria brevicollis TaxID=83679 RepID=A0AAE0UFA8_SORBR|nr:hypothetical protein B0T20DRAFT_402454 [Sordaria brevicollis]
MLFSAVGACLFVSFPFHGSKCLHLLGFLAPSNYHPDNSIISRCTNAGPPSHNTTHCITISAKKFFSNDMNS